MDQGIPGPWRNAKDEERKGWEEEEAMLTLGSCQVARSARFQVCLPKTPTSPPCRVHRLTVQSCEASRSKSWAGDPSDWGCKPAAGAQRTLLIPAGCALQHDSCTDRQNCSMQAFAWHTVLSRAVFGPAEQSCVWTTCWSQCGKFWAGAP